MYVAVKGGERAIDAAHDWLGRAHRGPADQPALDTAQIRDQMALAVARVMAEGSLYDPDLAALAITLLAATRLSMLPTVLIGVVSAGALRYLMG